jgi:hypothetical protein
MQLSVRHEIELLPNDMHNTYVLRFRCTILGDVNSDFIGIGNALSLCLDSLWGGSLLVSLWGAMFGETILHSTRQVGDFHRSGCMRCGGVDMGAAPWASESG